MTKVTLRVAAPFLAIALFLQFLQGQHSVDSVAAKLTRVINHELAQKQLPAVYIALVEKDAILWSRAFGYSDPESKTPATTNDVVRIASVSKLFTDIGVMQLVEQGLLDLDAPVSRYLPDFHPANPFDRSITLRQLMTHRAGLVREPPVGNYFDPSEPSLGETIESLNSTSLVYRPETRYKYSNAGVAVAGYVLEKIRQKPFARAIDETVLRTMGLTSSSFEPKPELLKRKPRAFLWTYDGRVFDAPAFQFGMSPAINVYSTLGDLATFMITLFKGGEGSQGRVLRQESLEAMWKPQFASSGQETGIGLGFFIGKKGSYRQISHSGDVYGFATEFTALPDQKLGVIVINTMNAANAWSTSMADYALDLLVARADRKPLPNYTTTREVDPELRKQLTGKYANNRYAVSFFEREGQLLMQGRTTRLAVRQHGTALMVDDKISRGSAVMIIPNGVVVGRDTLLRVSDEKPLPIPERWKGLVGEYGWDHNTLYIHERDGILHAQIEWYFSYPLTEISPDLFAFPEFGLYHGEQLHFNRQPDGFAREVRAAGVLFSRRAVGGKGTFTITPRKPINVLQRDALASSPPPEQGKFRSPDLVELVKLDSTIRLDVRYATTNNFMETVFYSQPRAFMQRPAAEALVRAHRWLRQFGYGILVHDAYRPWYVTKMFWDATPEHQRDFVADPSKGSRHNRGCAVDLTLYDLATGTPVEMVSGYDEFSVRAYPDYPGGTSLERWNRELLRRALEHQEFEVYVFEWWHFDYKDWKHYPILNLRFDRIQSDR
jgi:CubicO group peptidase (beta-lactamase class C family)/D-alanyl-D-alanine dipeptidase